MIILGKSQDILTPLFGQFGRQDQEVGSDGLQGGVEIFFGKTQSFEPMDQVVREQQELEKGHVGHPVFRGDLAQGIIVEEFAAIFLDGGSLGVELPDPPGMSLQVGAQDMVRIGSVLEQCELLSLDRIFGNGASHHHEAMRDFPVHRLVSKLSHLPAVAELVEPTLPASGFFDGGICPGHNHIPTMEPIEKLDDSSAEESRIGPNTDSRPAYLFGDFGQTTREERHCPDTAGGIAWSQAPVPELLEMRLEAQQGMVGASPRFLGLSPTLANWAWP